MKIAVAASGSGFLAPVHVGGFAAILAAGHEIGPIDSTSGGSVVSAIYAAGMSIDDMKQMALDADFSSFLGWSPFSLFTDAAYCNGNNLLAWLTKETGGKTFAQVETDVNMVATDSISGGKVLLNRKTVPDMPLALAARASAAIPFIYAPVDYSGMMLSDGGTSNNIDMDDLPDGCDLKLGIELTRKVEPMKPGMKTAITLASRIIEVTLAANEAAQERIGLLESARIARVDVTGFDMLNTRMHFSDRNELFNRGFAAVKAVMDSLNLPNCAKSQTDLSA